MHFNLHVIVNMPDGSEREFDWEQKDMPQGQLEDAIISVIEGNYDASSYLLSIVRHNDAQRSV